MEDSVLDFKKQLLNIINENDLLISIKYYVIKDIYEIMNQTYQQYLVNWENETQTHQATVTMDIANNDNLTEEAKNAWNNFQEIYNKDKQKQQEDDNK